MILLSHLSHARLAATSRSVIKVILVNQQTLKSKDSICTIKEAQSGLICGSLREAAPSPRQRKNGCGGGCGYMWAISMVASATHYCCFLLSSSIILKHSVSYRVKC